MEPATRAVEYLTEPADTAPLSGDEHAHLIPEYRGSETILVVDDNTMFRELLTLVLRGYGYTVVDAADGDAALTAAGRFNAPIHLVVTDVVMPRSDGPDLVGTLRGWYPGIQALFMSGYARGEAAVRDVVDATTEFIAKPFHVNDLVARVRGLLDNRLAAQG